MPNEGTWLLLQWSCEEAPALQHPDNLDMSVLGCHMQTRESIRCCHLDNLEMPAVGR